MSVSPSVAVAPDQLGGVSRNAADRRAQAIGFRPDLGSRRPSQFVDRIPEEMLERDTKSMRAQAQSLQRRIIQVSDEYLTH
jgi:hypothetical protein